MSPDFNNTFITFILCYSEINEDTSGGRSLNLNFTDEILRRTFRTLVLVNFNFGSQSWGDHIILTLIVSASWRGGHGKY